MSKLWIWPFRCIVSASSGRGVFDGNVKVERFAQQTDAAQLSRNILLSPKGSLPLLIHYSVLPRDYSLSPQFCTLHQTTCSHYTHVCSELVFAWKSKSGLLVTSSQQCPVVWDNGQWQIPGDFARSSFSPTWEIDCCLWWGHSDWTQSLVCCAATVNVKPNLQIVADDVKCSHGCAVSDLEDEQLFYFRWDSCASASMLCFPPFKPCLHFDNPQIVPGKSYHQANVSNRQVLQSF